MLRLDKALRVNTRSSKREFALSYALSTLFIFHF